MNPAQLLSHFDRISNAPDAILPLRQFILDLAVRGKLVEQDLNDEPAAELLKRIQAEKAQLVMEGKIKAQEPQPPIADGEIEYGLPTNWKPTRIGDLLTVIRGASPRPKGDPKYFSAERTPYHWIKISDIRKHSKDRTLYDTDEFLTKAGMEKSVLLPKGTLVVTNSATIGVPIFLGFEGGCVHDGYLAFPYFPASELSQDFFFVLFQTLQSYAVKKARGMAQLNLNTGLVRKFPLGLPPLAEQQRIVAKVDELMALCDRLEAAQTERESRRVRLAAASLQRLTQLTEDTLAFQDHARFYFSHLPRLTTRPEHIKQLRQTILNLAVSGKLVPQDPNDEPASKLLENIKKQKLQMLLEKGIRKEQDVEYSAPANASEIPTNWVCAHVDDVAIVQGGKRLPKGVAFSKETTDHIYIRVTDMKNGTISPDRLHYIEPKIQHSIARYTINKEDLYITIAGTIGQVGRVPDFFDGHNLTENAAKIVFRGLDTNYLCMALSSDWVQQQFKDKTKQMAQPKLALKRILGVKFHLPPLVEQRRIVTKVDELMALFDRLEAQLTNTQTESRRFLEATLHHALSA